MGVFVALSPFSTVSALNVPELGRGPWAPSGWQGGGASPGPSGPGGEAEMSKGRWGGRLCGRWTPGICWALLPALVLEAQGSGQAP